MPTVLDLFAGAGGLSQGLEDAGIEVVAAAEWDEDALATYARRHPSARLYPGDIAGIDFTDFHGSVDVIAGRPASHGVMAARGSDTMTRVTGSRSSSVPSGRSSRRPF